MFDDVQLWMLWWTICRVNERGLNADLWNTEPICSQTPDTHTHAYAISEKNLSQELELTHSGGWFNQSNHTLHTVYDRNTGQWRKSSEAGFELGWVSNWNVSFNVFHAKLCLLQQRRFVKTYLCRWSRMENVKRDMDREFRDPLESHSVLIHSNLRTHVWHSGCLKAVTRQTETQKN